jgi:pentatricopeptide repeat protein
LKLGQSVDIGRSVKVIETLKIMKERGVRPDILTYNSAMELFAKRAMEDEAWALVDDMKALGILPDIETYKFLLQVRMDNPYIYGTVADTVFSTRRLFARHLTKLLGLCSK